VADILEPLLSVSALLALRHTSGIGLSGITTPLIEKLSLQVLYPRRRARNGTPVRGRWGIELTTPLIEKLSLQVLYYQFQPPGAPRKRDSDQGRWGSIIG
jgi:hypothetical protein